MKTAGLVLIAIVCAACGFLLGEKKKKQCRDYTFLKDLITHLNSEIEFSRTELPACFLSYSDEKHKEVLALFADGNYKEGLSRLKIEEKDALRFLSFFTSLGRGPVTDELQKIGKFSLAVAKREEELLKSLKGSVRQDRVLGVCIGAVILLLFF